jgi:Helix-turn-helix domain
MPWEQPGRVYRALRLTKGLKQREVAEELDVKQAWVSQVETGQEKIPPAWSEEEELRVYDEQPERWDKQPRDRTLWDEVLALGDAAEGETCPCYTVGVLAEGDELPSMTDPLVVVRNRDLADEVAEKLAWAGVADVAVVPLWWSWVEQLGGAEAADADALWRALREAAN